MEARRPVKIWEVFSEHTIIIQKFSDWADKEINNKHTLRSNAKGCGGKTH